MNKLLLSFRILLGLCCSILTLLLLSYPDAVIAPDPSKQYLSGFHLYHYREFLWLIPFLAMEFVCAVGSKRNLVWFISLISPIVVGLLIWPLLQAYRPELLFPTFSYEDGKLSMGLAYMGMILVASILFRLLLNYFFADPAELYEDNEIGVVELDIDKAKTVREIVAENNQVKPNFLFGDADKGLIARFYERTRALLQLKRMQQVLVLSLVTLGVVWFFAAPVFLVSPAQAEARDWERMYDYQVDAQGNKLATHAAVHAAYRVLSKISADEALAGMSKAQAERFLRLNGVDSSYLAQIRDESDLIMNSAEDIFASRTRFLTITDGTRRVVLYIRENEDGTRINICEIQDDGWNAIVDYDRRRIGASWRSNVLSR